MGIIIFSDRWARSYHHIGYNCQEQSGGAGVDKINRQQQIATSNRADINIALYRLRRRTTNKAIARSFSQIAIAHATANSRRPNIACVPRIIWGPICPR